MSEDFRELIRDTSPAAQRALIYGAKEAMTAVSQHSLAQHAAIMRYENSDRGALASVELLEALARAVGPYGTIVGGGLMPLVFDGVDASILDQMAPDAAIDTHFAELVVAEKPAEHETAFALWCKTNPR